jgi:hypothetical protein
MKQFKSASHARRFLSAHDQINNLSISAAITLPLPSTELQDSDIPGLGGNL